MAAENPDDYISLHTAIASKYFFRNQSNPACQDFPQNNPACFEVRNNFQEKYNVNDILSACHIDLKGNELCFESANEDDDRVIIFHGGGRNFSIRKFKFFMPPGSNNVFWQSFTRTGTTAFAAVSMDRPPEVPAIIIQNARRIVTGKTAINRQIANGSISAIEGSNRIKQVINDFPVPITPRNEVIRQIMAGKDATGTQSIAYPTGEGGFFDLAASIVPALTEKEVDKYFSNGRWVYIHIFENQDGSLSQWGFRTDAQENLYVSWYQCMAGLGGSDNGGQPLFDENGEPSDASGICQQCIDLNGDDCQAANNKLPSVSIPSFTAVKSNTDGSTNGIRLSWLLDGPNVGKVSQLQILKNGNILQSFTAGNFASTSYLDADVTLEDGEQHTYQLSALDATGNQLAIAKTEITIDSKLIQLAPTIFHLEQIGNTLKITWSYINDNNFDRFLITRDNKVISDRVKHVNTSSDGLAQYVLEDPIDTAEDTVLNYQITAKAKDHASNDSNTLGGSIPFKFEPPTPQTFFNVTPPTRVIINALKDKSKITLVNGNLDYSYSYSLTSNEGFIARIEVKPAESKWLNLFTNELRTTSYRAGEILEGNKNVFTGDVERVDIYPLLDTSVLAGILNNANPIVSKTIQFFDANTENLVAEKEIIVQLDPSKRLTVKGLQSVYGTDADDINTGIEGINTNDEGLYLFVDFGVQVLPSGIAGSYKINDEIPVELDAGDLENNFISGYQIEGSLTNVLAPNQSPDTYTTVLFASEKKENGQLLEETETTEIVINKADIDKRITIRAGIDASTLSSPSSETEKYEIYAWVKIQPKGSTKETEAFESTIPFPMTDVLFGDGNLCKHIDEGEGLCRNGYTRSEHPLYKTKKIDEKHVITLFDNTFEGIGDGTYQFYVAIKKVGSSTFHYQQSARVVVNRE